MPMPLVDEKSQMSSISEDSGDQRSGNTELLGEEEEEDLLEEDEEDDMDMKGGQVPRCMWSECQVSWDWSQYWSLIGQWI